AAEEEIEDAREHGIADVLVQPGHRARTDAARKAVAHYQVIADVELLDERLQAAEVVGIVGVAHDDVLAAGRRDAALQGGAVALPLDADDAGAVFLGDLARAVGTAVVGHDHLGPDA